MDKDSEEYKCQQKLVDLRKTWEDRIEARIQEGIRFGVKNYRFYGASDLAWDSNIITKELVPLQLYAQGKLDFKSCAEQVCKELPKAEWPKHFDCEYNKDGMITGVKSVKPARFYEVVVNLVRSLISRRTAALSIKYTGVYPYLKFDPLSTSYVAKLRADVLSQRIEMITNQYGYRHDVVQLIRDVLMYGHVLEFATGAWDVESQIFEKIRAEGFDEDEPVAIEDMETETRIVREGVIFTRPHPTRSFWDTQFPLSSVNTDTGVTFMGYWDILRFRDIEKNPVYFNRDKITFNNSFMIQLGEYKDYWNLYYASAPVNFPKLDRFGPASISPDINDRTSNTGRYTAELADNSIALVEYRERVIPRDVGLGEYPYPVWVRLVVANDRTVVFGEILPSTPAVYAGYNEDDSRLINNAWAHDIMPWGDQLSNMTSQLLLTQKAGLLKFVSLNLDLLATEAQREQARKILRGEGWLEGPIVLEYSGAQYEERGDNPQKVVQMNEAQMHNDVSVFFRSISQLLSLAERILGVSSQELGQSAPREISATEVTAISDTTNTSLSFMGLGIDEALAAKKRMLYESFIAMGSNTVRVPVAERYQDATIKAAGFTVDTDDDVGSNLQSPETQTLIGTKDKLVYDYNYSNRDGDARASNAKAAEVMVNLLQQIVQIPGMADALGKERLFDYMNAIVRLSGAGVDLKFSLGDGETSDMPPAEGAVDPARAEINQAVAQIMDAIGQDRQKIDQLAQIVQQMTGGIPPAAPTMGAPIPVQ